MSPSPPRLATWLLQQLGPSLFSDSLAGDLLEDFDRAPSASRYWKEVIRAIVAAQVQRIKGALIPVLQGLSASWAMLALCMWAADALEHHWLQHFPGGFGPRLLALNAPDGAARWAELAQWGGWLAMIYLAHGAAAAMLAFVPRHQRSFAIFGLFLLLLDWKIPVFGGLMRHVMNSHPHQEAPSNLTELGAALLGVCAGIWFSYARNWFSSAASPSGRGDPR